MSLLDWTLLGWGGLAEGAAVEEGKGGSVVGRGGEVKESGSRRSRWLWLVFGVEDGRLPAPSERDRG